MQVEGVGGQRVSGVTVKVALVAPVCSAVPSMSGRAVWVSGSMVTRAAGFGVCQPSLSGVAALHRHGVGVAGEPNTAAMIGASPSRAVAVARMSPLRLVAGSGSSRSITASMPAWAAPVDTRNGVWNTIWNRRPLTSTTS
ncbi:hypothetical protein ACFQV2_31610 [Actinokineospora soli]|uniref:Uncharacterized protein n=1 Tax=Actinokineospora soli TaxID=1048753 RepID=A0ABW2TWF5_9PSEU